MTIPALVLSAALAASALSTPVAQEPIDLAACLGLELAELRETEAVDATLSRRVARICGVLESDARGVGRYTARTTHPRTRRDLSVVICRLPVAGIPGVEAVVIAAADGALVAVGLQGDAAAVEAWSSFVMQFRGKPARTAAESPSIATLRARRVDAALAEDADDRELRALLRLRGVMLRMAAHVMPIFTSDGAKSVPDVVIADLERGFREVSGLADTYPWIAETPEDFRGAAEAGLSYATRLPRKPEDDTEERRERLKAAGMRSCAACHMMRSDAFDGTLMEAAAARRHELGAGDGFFVLLHDVIPRKDDAEGSQRLATAVRMASIFAADG